MPTFGSSSKTHLSSCDHRIQRVLNEVVLHHDCTVIEGHRSLARQRELFESGRSKVKAGKHNASPSQAVDVAPYLKGIGIPWPNKEKRPATYEKDYWQFVHFAGYVMGIASSMDINLRWGGDWNRNFLLSDQTFDDLVHFELTHD